MSQQSFDLPGIEVGKRTETVEYGEHAIRDNVFAKRGHVDRRPNDYDPYNGAHYAGGPKSFELVQRTVVTYVGPWEAIS